MKRKPTKRKRNPHNEWLKEQEEILNAINEMIRDERLSADQANQISWDIRTLYNKIDDMLRAKEIQITVDTFDYEGYNEEIERKRKEKEYNDREERKRTLMERQRAAGLLKKKR